MTRKSLLALLMAAALLAGASAPAFAKSTTNNLNKPGQPAADKGGSKNLNASLPEADSSDDAVVAGTS